MIQFGPAEQLSRRGECDPLSGPARPPQRVALNLEARPGVLGDFLERALGCAALATVPVLGSEHLVDLIELEFGLPLRGTGGFPVEQLGGPTPVKVGTEHRDDKQAQGNSEHHDEEVGLRHGPYAPAGAGRVVGRSRAALLLVAV
jgi:hypothetical protein